MAASSVLDLIGNTPLVQARRLDTGVCTLFLKLECANPGGSIKDRIGRSMIEVAEKEGKIRPGQSTLVEATAGNTGLGLALVAALKGYKLVLVIPDKMSQEKIAHVRALGAEVVLTRSDVGKGHPQYYQDLAERIARETPGALYINQFANPANPLAHETSTGPEIWAQVSHQLDAVVCGVGSGGTLTGLSRFFARVDPHIDMVLADPEGSVLANHVEGKPLGQAGSWLVEGIGEDFIPPIADLSRVTKAYRVSDSEAFSTARELLVKEGILAGSSSGTLLAAALRFCREQTTPKRVVCIIPDTGSKYLSKMYSDTWLIDQGLLGQTNAGDLSDVISRRFQDGRVITVGPEDTLRVAYGRMRMYDISQLPVLEGTRVVGILDETALLLAIQQSEGFSRKVSEVMERSLAILPRTAQLQDLMPVFSRGMVPIIMDGSQFCGLITKIDAINFLRLHAAKK